MYYATTYAAARKNKISVSLVTVQGEIFEGAFFVAGEQRVKDLLNGPDVFLPFETGTGAIYLINRTTIARVVPRGEPEVRLSPRSSASAPAPQSSDNSA